VKLRRPGHALRVVARGKASTPRARTSGASAETADQPPRNLKLPVCCSASHFTWTGRPAISSRKGEDSSGVRRTTPRARAAAASIISISLMDLLQNGRDDGLRLGLVEERHMAAPGHLAKDHVGAAAAHLGGGFHDSRLEFAPRIRPSGRPSNASKSGQRSGASSGAKAAPRPRAARVVAQVQPVAILAVEARRRRRPRSRAGRSETPA
jgi:hypothetical protein